MQFYTGKNPIQTKDLLQAYKNAQQYVIDSAQSTKQKMLNGVRYLANLISTHASQIYSYVQDASHRLLPSRVSIMSLKNLESKTEARTEPSAIQEPVNTQARTEPPVIQESVDYSVISPLTNGEPKIVSLDSAPLETTPNNANSLYYAGLFMTAFLVLAAATNAFRGRTTQSEKTSAQPELFVLEEATGSQKPLPEPSSDRVIYEKPPCVETQLPPILGRTTQSEKNSAQPELFVLEEATGSQKPLPEPSSDRVIYEKPPCVETQLPPILGRPTQSEKNSAQPELFLLEGATGSQKLLPEPSSNRVIYGKPPRVETQLPTIFLPEPHKLPSNIIAYRKPEIRKATIEQGVAIMNNLFKEHGERPVPWETMLRELKPIRQRLVYTRDIFRQFNNIEKSVKGIALRSVKPRI
jgi:hypothetical protein